MGDDREEVAAQLRRVRDEARRRSPAVSPEEAGVRPARPADPTPSTRRAGPEGETLTPPAPPDAGPVNAAWQAEAGPSRGLSGRLRRLLERLLQPRLQAQRSFNAAQVQLDNEVLEYVEKRSAITHQHYDRLLGDLGRRLDEADERHALLERELVGHVQDLVRRIDLVLAEASRGRGGLEFALEEVRERLTRLEEVLRRPE